MLTVIQFLINKVLYAKTSAVITNTKLEKPLLSSYAIKSRLYTGPHPAPADPLAAFSS